MSKYRYLLVFTGLLLACSLPAQSEFTLESDAAYYKTALNHGFSGTNILSINHRFSPMLELDFRSDLGAYDRVILPNPQKLWHNASLEANYVLENYRIRAEYQNTVFGNSTLMGLFPTWEPLTSQKRLMQHQGTINADYTFSTLDINAYAQTKHLRYTPYVLDPNTFELVKQDNAGLTDLYYGLSLQTAIVPGISASISAAHKDGIFAENGQYRITDVSAGVNAEYNVFSRGVLNASFNWTNRDGIAISSQMRNLLQTRLRYHQRITNDVAGNILFVNNSCVDDSLNEVYLLTNYLRGQVQYSIPTDPSGGSFLLIGGKYSPDNKADAYFAEVDYRVWNNLYTGAALTIQPDQQTSYSGKISFYYNPVQEIHIQYTHRDNSHLNFETDYIGVGSSFYW